MKIAFFDSGVGGLSVLHHAMKILPNEEFIFFADEDHVPYGTKSKEEVLQYVDEAFQFLISQQVAAIVVACNTATSVAVKAMRAKYSIPIIGMEPAIKRAFDLYGDKRVLAAATPITVNGDKIKILIKRLGKGNLIDLLALPKLVEFAENLQFVSKDVEDYLSEQFAPYDLKNYSSLVLGCTHFNYFKDTMRKLLPNNVKFVDGNDGTLRELIRKLNLSLVEGKTPAQVEYFYSGRKVINKAELDKIEIYLQRLDEMYSIK